MSKLYFLLFFVLLFSCSKVNYDQIREEGRGVTRTLIRTLQSIQTKDQLIQQSSDLENQFVKMIQLMKKAEAYSLSHPNEERPEMVSLDHELSDQLRSELNRLYRIAGCKQIVEKCQDKAFKNS